MISGQICVFCNDFGDCHDKIVVASIDFICRLPICGLYLQGKGSFWEPRIKTTTPGHRSHRWWSQRGNQDWKGDKFASYHIPDDATADILSAI